MKIKFLILGDLSGKRVETFSKCLEKYKNIEYKILDWMEILENFSQLEQELKKSHIFRIEPPEKNMKIYKKFLDFGNKNFCESIKDLDYKLENNHIIEPKVWFDGIKKIFRKIDKVLKEHKHIYSMCNLEETLIMMDKEKTYDFLENSDIKKEFYLPKRMKNINNYDEFFSKINNRNAKYFIKLRYGSGGTGVLAYSYNPKLDEEKIQTSLNYKKEFSETHFYSTYNIKTYREKDIIKNMINWVIKNGAHIEQWLPKLTYEKYGYDTRVLILEKRAEYLLSRLSTKPITNLHLKNKRKESLEFLNIKEFEIVKNAAINVMQIFNKSLYSGIDVVLSTNNKPYIIDVNPFGDLFHNLINTDKNIYYLEIEAALRRILN